MLYSVAVVWFLVSTSGSARAGGGIAIGVVSGALLGGLVAASTLDTWHPRRVMLCADAMRFVGTTTIGIGWLLHHTPPALMLYALAASASFCNAFAQPARSSAIPMVVPREQLVRAGAAESLASGLVSVIWWAASGIIVAALDLAGVLLIDGALFLGSFALVVCTRWDRPAGVRTVPRGGQLTAAMRWIRRSRTGSRMALVESLHAMFTGLVVASLPLLMLSLGGGATLYGLQGGLSALATFAAAALLVHRVTARIGSLYAVGIAVHGVGTLLMALAPSAVLFLAGVFIAGLGIPAWTSARQVMLQTSAPDVVRGRVFATFDTVINVVLLPTCAMGVLFADIVGPRAVMVVAPLGYGVILLVIAWVGLASDRFDAVVSLKRPEVTGHRPAHPWPAQRPDPAGGVGCD